MKNCFHKMTIFFLKVRVACCTVGMLKHLSAEEICRNPRGSKQRLTNLAKHPLNQHSFYPLYPPAQDVPIDFSLANKTLHFSTIPDVLLLPSDLAHFVKVLSLGEGNIGEELVYMRKSRKTCERWRRLFFFAEIHYGWNPDSSSASIIRF